MKKLLLIPTMLFPYLLCAGMLYGIMTEMMNDGAMLAFGLACLASFLLTLVGNGVFILLSLKEDAKSLLKAALLVKAVHIPTYILIFIFGLILGLMFFFTMPMILLLVFIDYVTLFLSGMISVFALIKNIKKKTALSSVALACQFVFCADVISLFVVTLATKKERATGGVA